MIAATLILPANVCRPLGHRIESRLKQPGPGSYDYCATCSVGYAMALEQYDGDTERADEFVKDLRRVS